MYSTEILGNGCGCRFDGSYSVSLEDIRCGSVEIRYPESIEEQMIHADFRRAGHTTLTLESPSGEKTLYDLIIELDRCTITKK